MTTPPIVYIEIAERAAREYGAPLPHRLLTIGTSTGWLVRLNASGETQHGVAPYEAHVLWNEWPAGIIDAGGGVIAAGDAANEDALIAWLRSDKDGAQ